MNLEVGYRGRCATKEEYHLKVLDYDSMAMSIPLKEMTKPAITTTNASGGSYLLLKFTFMTTKYVVLT